MKLSAQIMAGGQDTRSPVPLPPNPNVKDADIEALVKWILDGAK